MCIDIVEFWSGIVSGQFRQILTEYSARDSQYFCFRAITSVNVKVFKPNIAHALVLRRSNLGSLMCKFRPFLTVIRPRHDNDGVLSFIIVSVSS